ncbi:bleomycin resistance protein [Flavobacteriaceae bacterium TP-CH-4]|uniref:Bleomycin resistance protein n=1 Tax=Pelagihabitans pacificus TaxID=2696054 RepID=A0A967AW71_9FLAO|nr:VOC family protein [Pelagihabitans pacificus]NHF60500.1 bleomycin resistance protein [Pelagihabitans pacificus]
MKTASFHLSLPCLSIGRTKEFYTGVVGADLGRNTSQWLDIDLFGNQITFTKSGGFNFSYQTYKFEDSVLPSFHFGVIVDQDTWQRLHDRLQSFEYEVTTQATFLRGQSGEHISFFVKDPNGYMVEFKHFRDQNEMFSQ